MEPTSRRVDARAALPAALSWAVCVGCVGAWTASVAGRVASPYPLEWMEGATRQHALRLLAGEPLYAAPSAEFIAYLYPPLGYVPMALAVALFGPSLPATRMASVVLFVLTAFAVGRAARSLSGDGRAGPLAVGLWAAGYGYGGGFADLARIDPTLLCLLAWGVERLSAGRVASGLGLLALSALAKQHGVLFFAGAAVWALFWQPRAMRRPVLAATLTLLVAGTALQYGSEGWFLTYVWTLPRSHGLLPSLLFGYLGVHVCLFLPLFAALSFVELRRARRAPEAAHVVLLAALAASALGRAHPGGDDNVLMPGYLLLCIVAAGPLLRGLAAGTSRRRAVFLAGLVVQLALLWQAPSHHWPSPATARGFRELARALDACGEGGTPSALDFTGFTDTSLAHTMALSDLRFGGPGPLADAGTAALLERLRGPRAPRALAVGASFHELDTLLAERYEPCRSLAGFPLPTGYQPRPQRVLRLRESPAAVAARVTAAAD